MSTGSVMQRRQMLVSALGGLLAATSAPVPAKPARAADFATNVQDQPLLAPFKGVTDASGDLDCDSLLLRGRWPAALRGRFYRNGPALMERGAERYHHWFDGDGMVQRFTIGDGRVAHRGRLVRTQKLLAEQRAGRFVRSALGTHIDNGPPAGGPDAFNTANTSVIEHAGRLLALWEGGSAYALDPSDLSTQGPVTWRADLQQVPFSAHPKVDTAGHLWNIGTFGEALIAWHIGPLGELAGVQIAESPYPHGMVHDVAVTERYLVVPLPPVKFELGKPSDGPRRFALEAGEPLRVLVMEKDNIRKRRVFELPPQLVFHVGNAHDTRDGHLVLSFVGAADASFLDQGAVALMSGRLPQAVGSALQTVHLDMASGRVQLASLAEQVEFPRLHPRLVGQAARHLVCAAGGGGGGSGLLHAVQVIDTHTGRVRRHDYGKHTVAEEHVVVPKPGLSGELDAWLLGTVYDARRRATVLNLLDAGRIEDGPVAQAVLPYTLPLGFHGNFTAT
ncbi:MAG TPA: carotenoid oxygenase family protein [Rubrivivax sp.]|nr:carotenoid oxygenase family protein [Rubrivivax sp.]